MKADVSFPYVDSIAIDQPVTDPYGLLADSHKPATVLIFRQVGDDWFSIQLAASSVVDTRQLEWITTVEAVIKGHSFTDCTTSNRFDLHQEVWYCRHKLKAFMENQGLEPMPRVHSRSSMTGAPAVLLTSDLPASLLVELYRLHSPDFGHMGSFCFNEHGVCINAEELALKTTTSNLKISLAQSPLSGLWGYAVSFETAEGGYWGESGPLTGRNCRYANRYQALLSAATYCKKRYGQYSSIRENIDRYIVGATQQLQLF